MAEKKGKLKVLLIWPFNQHALDILELYPLGLGYVYANIDKDRYDVSIMDCTIDAVPPESGRFAAYLRELSPDVVGISFWSSNAASVRSTVGAVRRECPGVTIVFGGPHATTYGEYEIENNNADFVIAGEGERSFPMLLGAVESGAEDLSSIPGLVFKDKKGEVISTAVVFEDDLDLLGDVDYEVMRLKDYHRAGYLYSGPAVVHHGRLTALMLATRGCAFRCKFCSATLLSGKKLRVHSPAYIVRTIKNLYDNFGVRVATLGDDNFTLRSSYAIELCEAIIELGLDDLVMTAPNGIRMSGLTRELVDKMVRAGFEEVTVAPESGSPATLERMRKDVNLELVSGVVDMCHEAGLKVKANFIIGYPGETEEDLLMTEAFIMDNDFDQIGLCFFQPLPGTPVFNELLARGEIDESFVPGRYNQCTYFPPDVDTVVLCDIFNRIMNGFRDSKGWNYENDKVGSIRC